MTVHWLAGWLAQLAANTFNWLGQYVCSGYIGLVVMQNSLFP